MATQETASGYTKIELERMCMEIDIQERAAYFVAEIRANVDAWYAGEITQDEMRAMNGKVHAQIAAESEAVRNAIVLCQKR